jgi:hypothetical protein
MRARLIFAVLVLASLPWAFGRFRLRSPGSESRGARRLAQVEQSLVSAVYTLPGAGWLQFELPRAREPIRVLTSGSLAGRPAPAEASALEWPYAIECRLLDAGGGILGERRYHHATKVTEYREPRGGERVTSSFYLAGGLVPTDARVMLIHPLELPPRATRLAIRLAEKDPELLDVTARVYHQETVPPRNLRYLWQRLPEERKQLLARANVYPAALLTESEKRNLLERRWAAIAPEGVEGSDYERRELYTPKELPGEEVRDEPLPGGYVAGPELRGVIPLPEFGGRLRLLLEPVRAELLPRQGTILIRWFGRSLAERSEQRQAWNGGPATFEASLAGGLVEVTPSEDMTVRAWLRRPGPGAIEEEITPEPAYVWAYLVEGSVAVEFDVLNRGPHPTPFRLDLRRPAGSPSGLSGHPTPVDAHYELLAEDGRTLEAGALPVDVPVSRYDAWGVRGRLTRISEAATYYLAIPRRAARLRVVSPQATMLVTGFDRPAELPRRMAIPEDAYDFNRDDVLQRSWFLLKAANAVELARLGRAPSLRVQPRPPSDALEIRVGQYEREEFQPEGALGARPLLTPWDSAEVPGGKALSAAFCEVPAGEEVPLRIEAEDGRREASPTLLYLSPSTGPLTLRSFLDGALRHEATVHAGRGLVGLPRLALGPHRFRATASRTARLWLSHVEPCRGRRLLKRLAYPVPATGLRFLVEKRSAGDETLSARFYAPRSAATRIQLRVELTPDRGHRVGPQRSWTFADRVYSVRPAGGAPVPLLEAGLEDVDGGQLFSIPLGSDLPPGRYQLRVAPQPAARAWLSLARTSGLAEVRELFIERGAGT